MRTTSQRVTAGIWMVCGIACIAAIILGVLGIVGVRTADARATSINNQQIADGLLVGELSRSAGLAQNTVQTLMTADVQDRQRLTALLFGTYVPTVEARLTDIQRSHADHPQDAATIANLRSLWAKARDLAGTATVASAGIEPITAPEVNAAFAALNNATDRLGEQDRAEAIVRQAASAEVSSKTTGALITTVVLAILVAIASGWTGSRRIRRALEPAEDQVKFADTMQLALDEVEAHLVLKRHLERGTPGTVATVLNRNNSADRLEAVTEIPAGSVLQQTLEHAQPSSCLAVRSGRRHDEDDGRPALLACPVCGPCPGRSSCHPLTVGGLVIGSVLVNGSKTMDASQHQRVRDSVGQAAPVLANLRNLAIAEMRAATDGLTALPNKRTVTETLMRMLAQASRTLTPLCLLMLDLDHFKDVNDRFGHPVGDQALASVGAVLRSVLRDGDFAGRNGGEEFAVMLPDTDLAGAKVTAEKIRAAVAEIKFPGIDLVLTISIGIAAFPEHALSTERLERLADSALYVAKRSGRNRVEVAAPPATAATPSGVAPSAGPRRPAVPQPVQSADQPGAPTLAGPA